MSAENGKIRFPKTNNPIIYPPNGSYYVWIATDGAMKKMDENGVVTNLTAQSISDMTDVNLTGLQNGQVLTWSDGLQKWIPSDSSNATDFLALSDVTETTYAGSSGKVVTVNETENGLEFTDKLGGASLTQARYKYQTATSVMQGQGKIRFNNADISLATKLYINTVDFDGIDHSQFLSVFLNDTFNIFLQSEGNKNAIVKVDITTVGVLNENQNTISYDCEFVRGTTVPLTDNEICSIVFSEDIEQAPDNYTATIADLTSRIESLETVVNYISYLMGL